MPDDQHRIPVMRKDSEQQQPPAEVGNSYLTMALLVSAAGRSVILSGLNSFLALLLTDLRCQHNRKERTRGRTKPQRRISGGITSGSTTDVSKAHAM